MGRALQSALYELSDANRVAGVGCILEVLIVDVEVDVDSALILNITTDGNGRCFINRNMGEENTGVASRFA